ncbi:YceD family protein [Anaerobium acetethylicum]|uniref:DUF177 domain-containing protein n=1 Tax=Anaerobium acetethylicum TaxID=1619234 RepID=A0A1D3TPY5_9FIRM|nr:DUF177 domain-containing protein [Anaerobium acetethylicum]SCP95462.1 uncharacterized protein SAMN05421730_1001585 [Anaerobium acetethylicum]
MLIDLSNVLSREDKVVHTQVPVEMDYFKSALGSFKIIEKELVDLTITNVGKREVLISGTCNLSLEIPCARCLEPVKTDFHLEITRSIDMKLSEEDRIKELDESNFVIGCSLDIDTLVYNEILVNWPMKVLCGDDCKGICNRCGANLNHGNCGCDVTELDPRMSVIRDIFNNSKK